ncbi:nucleotide sugar dehydrogenase [Pokkaliibacter sp. MBI-7]|uniref:UDP-glucose dehydrogenase family protein n=1 Tax=Pokkaliibacter sp. MBI-7 TaxID=3040600 RepID=UPI00244C48C4|nr:nucleotide sugar dehydrogenase [Pokkaliibacter sp. MBI-7]MDH2431226.1 nucleotide sugar dehydrogenase [Pokkaliibacter sp. MBI-7]
MDIGIYGLSLTGVVTAVSLAHVGNNVVLMPAPGESLQMVEWQSLLSDEPGLLAAFNKEQLEGRLKVEVGHQKLLPGKDAHFLALDPDAYASLDEWLGLDQLVDERVLLIIQTAVPVGTAERLQASIAQNWAKQGFSSPYAVVSMPDFIRQGTALDNFQRPGRVLVGCDVDWPRALMRDILRPFNRNRDSLLFMSSREAEFSKFVVNGMLATKLSFMNEMANLAELLDVDIEKVRHGVGSDSRIGYDYIYPGCGFGGAHFSADIIRLAAQVEQSGGHGNLLQSVLKINEQQKEVLFRKLWCHYQGQLKGRTVAVWGASFKPNTSSMRNAPSLVLMEALWAQGCSVRLHDPKALDNVRELLGDRDDLVLCSDPYEAVAGADALLLMTEWKDYWSPDYRRLMQLLKTPLVLDGRNIYDPYLMAERGFIYQGVGRRTA